MKWTTEKLNHLKSRYPHEDNGTLARELGCSRKALAFRASHMGIKKTETYNEARYAKLGTRPPEHLMQGETREISTGTIIIKGRTLTHLSNYSVLRGT